MTDSTTNEGRASLPRRMRRPRSRRDLRALAGRGRLRARRRRLSGGRDEAAVRHRAAAAERHGALHIGHAFTADVEDVMVRHARMQGRPTLWLPGLDHASIAAQVVLDRILEKEGESRASLGRERYLERMWAFVEQTRDTILRQSRRFGSSLDWSRTRFTMDEVSSKAVRTAFTRLHRDGLAYRTEALVNWCPGCRTSVSDLEVVPTPETGMLWTVRYHLLDGAGRPDPDSWIRSRRPARTILGDVAVAVHPEDPRYADWIGRTVVIPRRPARSGHRRRGRPTEFGTGAVKITRPRRGRQRDGPPPWSPGDQHPGRRRPAERGRRLVRRPRPLRRPTADPGRPEAMAISRRRRPTR